MVVTSRRVVWKLVAVALLAAGGCDSDDDVDAGQQSSTVTTKVDHETTDLIARFRVHFEHEVTSPTSCPVRRTDFIDLSVGEPASWRWEYGDGQTRTEQSPSFDLLIFGQITLTVTDADGSTSSSTRMIAPPPEC